MKPCLPCARIETGALDLGILDWGGPAAADFRVLNLGSVGSGVVGVWLLGFGGEVHRPTLL